VKLAHLRRLALSLPEVTEEPHHHMSSFRVRGKIFVTVTPEEKHAHVFVDENDREPALALYPDFLEMLYWGRKATGLRVTLAAADPEVVAGLVKKAWKRKAPKGLGLEI
jgi:hypothetical protein